MEEENNQVLDADKTSERVTNDLGNLRKLNPNQLWGQMRASMTYSRVPHRLRY